VVPGREGAVGCVTGYEASDDTVFVHFACYAKCSGSDCLPDRDGQRECAGVADNTFFVRFECYSKCSAHTATNWKHFGERSQRACGRDLMPQTYPYADVARVPQPNE
jgi:hypothetical protein